MSAIAGFCFLVLAALLAAFPAHASDAPGSHDSPLVSRYSGSTIIGYAHSAYSALDIAAGPEQYHCCKGHPGFAKTKHAEGDVTRIIYVDPRGRSPLEVFRNYQDALKNGGFTILYSCDGASCGKLFHQAIYPQSEELHQSQQTEFAFGTVEDQHYLFAEHDDAKGNAYVALYTATDVNDAGTYEGPSRTMSYLQVVTAKPMQEKMVTVDADAMARDIAARGHVAIYGVYFDFNKASLKPGSKSALGQMAKLLASRPDLKVYVVGHTDNVGTIGYNLDLSRRRAKAVAQALETTYHIATARLAAYGVGPLAPVASNATDAGRARNRRVELVKQ